MNDSVYLMDINVPPLLEEALVDCLLSLEAEHDFSSFKVNAHNNDHTHLSLSEQVAGQKKQCRFQIYLPKEDMQQLISQLKQNFSGSEMHYWVLPVLDSGYI